MDDDEPERHVTHKPDTKAGAERFLDMLAATASFDDEELVASTAFASFYDGVRATDLMDMVVGAWWVATHLLTEAHHEQEEQLEEIRRLRGRLEHWGQHDG